MDKAKILTIDDERQIRKFLRIGLEGEGYIVLEAEGADAGLAALVKQKPDIILLDLNLGDGYGLDLLKRIREFSPVPVVVLSVKDSEADKVELLEAGADDYLTKPFGMAELLARLRVILRRQAVVSAGTEPTFKSGNLEIDFTTRKVLFKGANVHLTPTEYNLVCLLSKNAGKVVTTQQIMREIWGPGLANETGYLRVYITTLRKKIEDHPDRPVLLVNEPAIGYRLNLLPPE